MDGGIIQLQRHLVDYTASLFDEVAIFYNFHSTFIAYTEVERKLRLVQWIVLVMYLFCLKRAF